MTEEPTFNATTVDQGVAILENNISDLVDSLSTNTTLDDVKAEVKSQGYVVLEKYAMNPDRLLPFSEDYKAEYESENSITYFSWANLVKIKWVESL
tara:strand:- start:220 stop:507 length:288 start_codon:yes stop_codon:yes gene_type:complete